MILSLLAGAVLSQMLRAVAPEAAQPPAAQADWRAAEAPLLTRHVQLTFPDKFIKAGEQYFDHQSPPGWIVFQAIERPAAGQEPDPNYAMYVARLTRGGDGGITGIEGPIRLSGPGSSNTCGWFHPTEPGTVIFGSTLRPPAAADSPGYSRDRQRYSWQFPTEMEIVTAMVRPIAAEHPGADAKLRETLKTVEAVCGPHELFSRPGYDAECSFSKDGRFVVYTHVDPTNNDPNIWIYDTKRERHYPIVTARGYDGGPFFSPDGKWLCYRSDRKGDNVLQLYLAELAFGDDGDSGVPIGVSREIQLTQETPGKPDSEQAVSWCPYFHPTGGYLVYATSEVGHQNYEVFAIEVSPGKARDELRKARVTHAPGFDGLPAFSGDGKLMIWTSQRGAKRADEQRPSSQMWIAEVAGEPVWTGK